MSVIFCFHVSYNDLETTYTYNYRRDKITAYNE